MHIDRHAGIGQRGECGIMTLLNRHATGAITSPYAPSTFGRRVSKTVDNQTTYFMYADEGLVGEYSVSGMFQKAYGWTPNGIWGTNPVFLVKNGQYYYYNNDHLGTPQTMTDSSGNMVWRANYAAFGQASVSESSTVTNNLRFPGQYFDEETGLHYNWNRYYDPVSGRYTQVDPIGFAAGDENLYRYNWNSSQNMFDPYGLYSLGDLGYDTSNVLIGMGDVISLGLTQKIRQANGNDDSVNKCSGAYKGGRVAGYAWWAAFGSGITFEKAFVNKSSIRILDNASDWFRSNVFRWGKNTWKGGSGWHFHVGPEELMDYHLPQQAYSWYRNGLNIVKRWFK